MATPDALTKAINRLADVHEKGFKDVSEALSSVAYGLKQLGNGNASNQVGAIEGLGMALKEAADSIAGSVDSMAAALDSQPEEEA